MSWFEDLATPYHQQDTDYYCGAAVAQMILESIGAGILDQNTLYASNHAHSTPGWYTGPEGLNYTLNAFMPAPPVFNSYFVLDKSATEAEGSAIIVSTLRWFKVATGTLVYGCGHWVAVRGVKTNTDPAEGEGTYSIDGFYINNPWPPTPSATTPALAPPPPHSNADGCGSGGNRGVANEYVTYADWQSTYFTGCGGQFVSVCDPRRPPMRRLQPLGRTRMRDGSRLITPEQALEAAARGVTRHLETEPPCRLTPALKRSHPHSAHLVQRLDRPDDYYYLVTLEHDGRPTAVVRGDALFGTFHGALSLSEGGAMPMLDQAQALEAARSAAIELDDGAGRLILRDGGFSVYPALVWRPCQESRSPYYPFHQINVGARTIYVGHDGRVYPKLHDLGRG